MNVNYMGINACLEVMLISFCSLTFFTNQPGFKTKVSREDIDPIITRICFIICSFSVTLSAAGFRPQV